ncbi:VRR-NUC domain-containing protein [Arthrobacter sp. HLT1-21]
MTAREYRLWMCNQWTEAQLQGKIVQLAEELGWLVYHTHDSRRSQKGWPDLVLLHPVRNEFMIWELKSAKGYPTKHQKIWLAALAAVGITVGIRKPEDWASEQIQRELRGQAA